MLKRYVDVLRKDPVSKFLLGILTVLCIVTIAVIVTVKTVQPTDYGERYQYNCSEQDGMQQCDVWEQDMDGKRLCYRGVPKDIPVDDILCNYSNP